MATKETPSKCTKRSERKKGRRGARTGDEVTERSRPGKRSRTTLVDEPLFDGIRKDHREKSDALKQFLTLKGRAEHANRAMGTKVVTELTPGSLSEQVAKKFLITFPTISKTAEHSATALTEAELRTHHMSDLTASQKAEFDFAIRRAKSALSATFKKD